MATGHRDINGVELDTLFMAYQSGTKHADCGFRNLSGVDLSQLFQPYTTGAKRGPVGFRNLAGTDLSDLFQNSAVPLFTVSHPANLQVDHITFSPSNPSAGASYRPDGQILYNVDNIVSPTTTNWGSPTTTDVGAGYWIRAILSSGVTPSGSALSTALQLNVARGWTVTRSTLGTSTATLAIAIATDSGMSNIVASGNLILSAEKA